jgi:hypothetical membrane protein
MEAAAEPGRYVRRSVHPGAVLWIVGVVEFVVAMAVVQLAWTNPSYSLTQNVISDLGAVHCGLQSGRDVCSPLHTVFNVSVVVVGILLIAGLWFAYSALPRGRWGQLGSGLLLVSGLGAIGVGLNPEDVRLSLHLLSAALAFGGGNLALVAYGIAMRSDPRWRRLASLTLGLGVVGLAAFVLIAARAYDWGGVFSAWGEGGIERTIAAPLFVWAAIAAIALLRRPEFAPRRVEAARSGS